MRKLWLKKNEDRRIRAGHLWVFSNEVDTQKSPLTDFTPGEEATLCDARGALWAAPAEPGSLICARLHAHRADTPLDKTLLHERLSRALILRQRLFPEPWYRLCHGEGDFLPGLVIDRYGEHCTLQISTAGMESRKEFIVQCLDELLAPASLLFDNDLAARGPGGPFPRGPESWRPAWTSGSAGKRLPLFRALRHGPENRLVLRSARQPARAGALRGRRGRTGHFLLCGRASA